MDSNLIYDIGMHKGKDTEFYLKKGFKVIGVEANPILVDMCKHKFQKEIEEGKLIIVDKAISYENGKIQFFIDENKNDWGSIAKEWNFYSNKMVREIIVESIQLQDIISNYGMPYYMKIDIEGADIFCLQALLKMNIKPQYISAELLAPHNSATNMDCLDILSTLKVLGYSRFNIIDQHYNNATKCPFPALEGKYVDYKFDEESSGLFGKELSDSWSNFDDLTYYYLEYYHEYKRKNINLLIRSINKYLKLNIKENPLFSKYHWYDIHATF